MGISKNAIGEYRKPLGNDLLRRQVSSRVLSGKKGNSWPLNNVKGASGWSGQP